MASGLLLLLAMNARTSGKYLVQSLQLCANEQGLILLNVKRRASRPQPALPPNATPTQILKAHFERFIDHLFGL